MYGLLFLVLVGHAFKPYTSMAVLLLLLLLLLWKICKIGDEITKYQVFPVLELNKTLYNIYYDLNSFCFVWKANSIDLS
jgi:hypothetical protein